jgi:Flp pilus assembly protein TadD
MQNSAARPVALLLAACCFLTIACAQQVQEPLREDQLLALVGGAALPENLVAAIRERGVCFQADDSIRSQLKDASADPAVMAALASAKTFDSGPCKEAPNKDELLHLGNAAKLMHNKDYSAAPGELTAAMAASSRKASSGFVMGQLLRQQERYDQAAAVYAEVLSRDPKFPEIHTKLSYNLYRAGDEDGSLREAKAALAITPNNPEAHKNAGLALLELTKYVAAEGEFREALRLKGDYEPAFFDLAFMFSRKGDVNATIENGKKAVALDPNDANAHLVLANALEDKGDFMGSIQEHREDKRLDPQNLDAREGLAFTLGRHGFAAEALLEYREMQKIFPTEKICHACLAGALQATWDLQGAEAEYVVAAHLDPSDPRPHIGLGSLREDEKKYDQALDEYRMAEKLDPTLLDAHVRVGRVLLAKNDVASAAAEFKIAEYLAPADWHVHELYAQTLAASGKQDDAIGELRQATSLDPSNLQVKLEFAAALEKNGDWSAAIDEYHKAALADASIDRRNKVFRTSDLKPPDEYKKAQERLNEHIAALKSTGKAAEAAQLEAQIHTLEAAPSLSQKLDQAMAAGAQANAQRNFDEAARQYKEAVELAEQVHPLDARLPTALEHLGNEYLGVNPAAAQAAYERELKVSAEIFGPNSPNLAAPLQSLGRNAMMQRDYPSAEKFFFQAVDVNEKVFGESSGQVASALVMAAGVYFAQQDYAKAEPYLLRAVKIDESLYGRGCFSATSGGATTAHFRVEKEFGCGASAGAQNEAKSKT